MRNAVYVVPAITAPTFVILICTKLFASRTAAAVRAWGQLGSRNTWRPIFHENSFSIRRQAEFCLAKENAGTALPPETALITPKAFGAAKAEMSPLLRGAAPAF